MRVSVSNARTREADIDRSAEAVLAAYRVERGAGRRELRPAPSPRGACPPNEGSFSAVRAGR